MRWLLPMLSVLFCTSCNAPDSDVSGPPRGEPRASEATSPSTPHQLIDQQPTWPAADRLDREALAALPAEAAEAVSASTLPVLVPRRHDLLAAAVLMTQPRWYALSTRSNGMVVSLHASRAAHRYAHIDRLPGSRALRGGSGFVGQNRGIWSASWRENGVAYALDVECSSQTDSRCADEVELLALVADLAYVGGVGATEVPR